jgi:lincosamide nucleotidyltransferase A/C/D/E
MLTMYEMSGEKAIELYQLLDRAGIKIWIDGGWAVDALLGKHTRAHEDLDIVIETRDLSRMVSLLAAHGITEAGEDYALPWNFLLRNDASIQVDVHAILFDAEGIPMYGPPEGAVVYPDLSGQGIIAGQSVRCTTPQSLVEYRTGFELRARDFHDVRLLCARFGIELPQQYRQKGEH